MDMEMDMEQRSDSGRVSLRTQNKRERDDYSSMLICQPSRESIQVFGGEEHQRIGCYCSSRYVFVSEIKDSGRK